MSPSTKTTVLAVVAALLLALNLVDTGTSQRLSDTLPILDAVPREQASRIELSTATTKVVLEAVPLDGDAGIGEETVRWVITSPIEATADQQAVKALLMSFRKAVPLDVKVDESNDDAYGLDAGNGVVVELWKGERDPAVSFTIGNDGPSGTSFLRVSGDESVYRARLGGRGRYARKAVEWRKRVLLDFTADQVSGLTLKAGGGVVTELVRGASLGTDENGLPLPGPWELSPDPGYATDQLLADSIVTSMGAMRAGEILGEDFDGGFSPPRATLSFTLATGDTRVLEVGSRAVSGGAFVRLQGEPDVYRVAAATLAKAQATPVDLRDKTVFRFARQQVDTMAFQPLGQEATILQQDLANGLWNVIQPDNIDIDVKFVFFAVNTLGSLRADDVADGVSAEDAGLSPPRERLVLHFLDGHNEGLEVGTPVRNEAGRVYHYVRRAGGDQIFLVRESVITKLRAGFGRG